MGKEFTSEDFYLLNNSIPGCGLWFCQKKSDLMLFLQVCERTIRFHKFSEKIPVDQFCHGVPNTIPPVLGYSSWNKTSIQRARDRLVKKNILYVGGKKQGHSSVYAINVPGLLSVLCDFYPALIKLVDLQRKTAGYFAEKNLMFLGPVECPKEIIKNMHTCAKNGGDPMLIDEAVGVGKAKGDVSLKRQQAKKQSNLACHPAAVFSAMKDYCKQEEIPYREYPTGKLKGCATYWVKEFVDYDEADRMSALEFLYRICDKWLDIRSALEDAGHPRLSERVNFEEYYEFRRYINDFMAGGSIRSKFGGKKKQRCSVDFELTHIDDLK